MKRAVRTVGVLALIGAAAATLGGLIALLIHHFGRTAERTDRG